MLAATIEDWVTQRQSWEFILLEGHAFGRANNVEGELLFVAGEQPSSLLFRLEQLEAVEELESELLLGFEEREGIARIARITPNGLDVELSHILRHVKQNIRAQERTRAHGRACALDG